VLATLSEKEFSVRNLVLLLWPLLGCTGVLAFRFANGYGIELIFVILGITLGPILVIAWVVDAFRVKMGWARW
jgi:hypothetical protein